MYRLPPVKLNEAGKECKVGLELEFAGISCADAASAIQGTLGGQVHQHSEHRSVVEDTFLGTVVVELDARFVHSPSEKCETKAVTLARDVLGSFASTVVPCEVITEPIAIGQLHEAENLTFCLRHDLLP